MKIKKPKNWPDDFTYSPESVGVDVHIEILRLALSSDNPKDQTKITPCIEEKRVHLDLEIRKIVPPHPLARIKISGREQIGLFAKKKIPKGANLGEYTGEIRLVSYGSPEAEEATSYNWVLVWRHHSFLCIDSRKIGNEMAFVNDYRGLKEAPNASIKWMINRGLYYFGYAASREIEPDEEIVVDYGSEWATFYEQKFASSQPLSAKHP